jgi:translation initiation factor 2 alpha subunit (eIF-2alpha)
LDTNKHITAEGSMSKFQKYSDLETQTYLSEVIDYWIRREAIDSFLLSQLSLEVDWLSME